MEKVKKVKLSSNLFINILKGASIAVSFSLVFILCFALIIKFFNLPDKIIMPINQILKIISIFLGCYFSLKNNHKNGLITGLFIGITYTILSFAIFSLLSKTLSISATLFSDIMFAAIIGSICGIFLVNKKIKTN